MKRELLQHLNWSIALSLLTLSTAFAQTPVVTGKVSDISDGSGLPGVSITGRHHAGEAMASYALEGFMIALLSDKKEMDWLRRNARFMIIPFVDKDGVEEATRAKTGMGGTTTATTVEKASMLQPMPCATRFRNGPVAISTSPSICIVRM